MIISDPYDSIWGSPTINSHDHSDGYRKNLNQIEMNFKNSPQTHEKETSPYYWSRQSSSKSSSRAKPHKHVEPPSPALPAGCCRGFSNVKNNTGSTASTSQQNQQHQLYQRLELKVVFMYCMSFSFGLEGRGVHT